MVIETQHRPVLYQISTIFGLFVLVVSLSPIFLVLIAMIGLVVLPPRQHYQWILGIFFIAGMAFTYASRKIGVSPFDDFANVYYPMFQEISGDGVLKVLSGRWSEFSISSIEVGFPILLSVFAIFDPGMSAKVLILFLTFLCGLFYLYWMIAYVSPNLPNKKSNIALLLSLGFFSFGLCSQLTRQMLSIPFFLMAISDKNISRSFFFLIIGTMFHFVTLPLFLFATGLRLFPRLSVLGSLLGGSIVFVYGKTIAAGILGVEVGIFDKLAYYTTGNMDASDFNYRFLLFSVSWIFLCFLGRKHNTIISNKFVLLMAFFYICFLVFPLLSFRLTLVVSGGLFGILIFFSLMRLKPQGLQLGLALFFVTANQFRRWVFYDQESGMSLWHTYAQVGAFPFYYLH